MKNPCDRYTGQNKQNRCDCTILPINGVMKMKNNEMTEREMLEFAAKAYGLGSDSGGFIWTESEYPRGSNTNGALWNYKGWHDTAELWNPLTDDGDALRLAVKLNILWDVNVHYTKFLDLSETNAMSATRRAIVRSAAEIGKRMA